MNYIDTSMMLKEYTKGFNFFKFLRTIEKIITFICFAVIIMSIYFVEKEYKNNNFYKLSNFIIIYIVALVVLAFTSYKIGERLRKKVNINNTTMENNELIRIIRGRKFIKFIEEDCFIRTMKQKEQLIEILKHDMEKYRVNSIWIIGVVATLSLPLWSKLIVGMDFSLLREIITLYTIMLFIIASLKYFVFNNILLLLNRKNERFKDMIYIIRQDLILNHYNKEENVNKNKEDSINRLLKFHGVE